MKPSNQYLADILDLDSPQSTHDTIWLAGRPTAIAAVAGSVTLLVPFQAQKKGFKFLPDETIPVRLLPVTIRAYGDAVVRASFGPVLEDSPMLHWDLQPEPLTVSGWNAVDSHGRVRLSVATEQPVLRPWDKSQMPPPPEPFAVTIFPDGKTAVPFMATDRFFPMAVESLALAFVERDGQPHRTTFSLAAEPNEHFAGTGERFSRSDLAGQTLILENADGLGVNNRRAYKNIPFYLSSRPYGLFVHTHAHLRLSLAGVSTRAALGLVEEPAVDLFFIGGGTPERILFNYRRVTGFPPELPTWSYGMWMARMSYETAAEVRTVARRLRDGNFPCDVLHVDVSWFAEPWVCDWEFGKQNFPEPEKFIAELRNQGYRLTLWQLPHVARTAKIYAEAKAQGYVVESETAGKISDSIFSGLEFVATIDFTKPAAVAWYQGLLQRLYQQGVAAFKCDFGEHIHMDCEYAAMPGRRLHNLYSLLYQKAAFEAKAAGVIWARSAWAGCQRYPLHWSGDSAGSWDGLAGSLRGGLHFGMSGFAFWSHDVPGFHGVPNFMHSWPSDNLYVRWTQFGVFTSHLRYHGAQPREPYEYPAVADIVRKWLRLRYALIPYLLDEARAATQSGYPVLRALALHHPDDPLCWHIDDQYYFGSALLVAPVMNDTGVRDVYLPAGDWVDLWTGQAFHGPQLLRGVASPLDRIPVFAKQGARIRVYPDRVQSTDEMDLTKCRDLVFAAGYPGLSASVLGQVTEL